MEYPYPIESARHAFFVGAIVGQAMRYGVWLQPTVDLNGNYTAELSLALGDVTVSVVVPPPPPEWRIEDWLEKS